MRTLFFLFILQVASGLFARSSDDKPKHFSRYQKDASEYEPWFTGPILAPAAKVVPKGHTNHEPYLYVTDNIGIYEHHFKAVRKNQSVTVNPLMDLTHGLFDKIDIQIIAPMIWNFKNKQNDLRYGDTTVYLGYQALYDKRGSFRPDLRITLSETFPSGHYDHFDPKKEGTGNSGSGSFQTSLAFNFQKLFYFHPKLLRVRWNVAYTAPSPVKIESFNAYGGGFGTQGTVKPGHRFSTILAFEYTLTQNICPALDIQYVCDAKQTFKGNSGIQRDNQPANLNKSSSNQLSLAPAIEYNFNAHIGIVGGVWFSVFGKNSQDFVSGVIALNIYH